MSDEKVEQKTEEELFYIQDARQVVGNCALWWRPNGRGYTTELEDAGKYTRGEAFKNKRETDVPFPCSQVDGMAHRHVRLEALSSLRPQRDDKASLEGVDKDEVWRLVERFFKNRGSLSPVKDTERWMKANNPLLGDMSPDDMIGLGKVRRLLSFVRAQLAENNPLSGR